MACSNIRVTEVVSVPFEENTYIVRAEGDHPCVVVDPGLEPEKVIAAIEETGHPPAAILNTHGHSDHIAGNAALKERWPDCPLVIGRREAPKLTDPRANLSAMFGVPLRSPAADVLLDDGQTYEAGGIRFRAMEIPGHSSGHMVYVIEDHSPILVLVGDVIFAGSIGRTDFPDGSFEQLISGIQAKLFTLPDNTLLYPGHGPPTTVGEEKVSNPFVGQES